MTRAGAVPLVWLMREARDVYRDVIGRELQEAGCDDIPRNGAFVLARLDRLEHEPAFSSQADVVASLGLTKQAASQLIDTLVLREYLERRVDPRDRRRMEVRLTGRGRTATRAVQSAIERVDTALAEQLSAQQLSGLRAGLTAFGTIREQTLA